MGVAAALEVSKGVIQSARVGLTGAGPSATRLENVETALVGQPATAARAEAASRLAGTGLSELNGDIHASAENRRAMIPVFTERALTRAMARQR